MGTTTIAQNTLMASIALYRDNLIDTDLALDGASLHVENALEEQERVHQERDRVARHLQHLIDLHEEATSVSETFGPEVAEVFLAGVESRV